MDKLGTFFSKELRSNKQAKELFNAAGCGELLKLEFKGLQDFRKEPSNHDLADFIQQANPSKSGLDFDAGLNFT